MVHVNSIRQRTRTTHSRHLQPGNISDVHNKHMVTCQVGVAVLGYAREDLRLQMLVLFVFDVPPSCSVTNVPRNHNPATFLASFLQQPNRKLGILDRYPFWNGDMSRCRAKNWKRLVLKSKLY
jgi:hypothetical protein